MSKYSKNMTLASLFSGIGGFDVGLKNAGMELACLCEIDTAARAVLSSRYSNINLTNDVKNIKNIDADVVTAGFPCQNLSSVGRKEGIEGAQSSLVDEVFRILKANPIEWVIVENVKFMLHLNKGLAMHRIIEGFEQLGYNWAYRVLTSQAFGLPQRRERVYFVASRNNDPRHVVLSEDVGEAASSPLSIDQHIGFYWTEGRYAAGLTLNGIPPLKSGSSIGIPSPPAILFPDGLVATPDIKDAERLQGFVADWTLPAELEVRKSLRWRLVGNAVSVPIAEWIGRKIRNPIPYDDSMDTKLKGKWPNAAWGMKGDRRVSNVSAWPFDIHCPIGDFLLYEPKPLSFKATKGFVSRAKTSNLKFPHGFIEALEKHLKNAT